ncbi:hypothetical protein ACTI_52860 [Actinoplanes sp. OR16]|nr:hypothetical protein ACTI_52860 [Actinoplanes sp. OR16]
MPGVLLMVALCLVGVCALPSSLFFVLLGVHGGSLFTPPVLIGAPVLVAYVVAFVLWRRARRTASRRRAWVMVVVGLVLVGGAAVVPTTILGSALADVWKETQPGGRGYVGPE